MTPPYDTIFAGQPHTVYTRLSSRYTNASQGELVRRRYGQAPVEAQHHWYLALTFRPLTQTKIHGLNEDDSDSMHHLLCV